MHVTTEMGELAARTRVEVARLRNEVPAVERTKRAWQESVRYFAMMAAAAGICAALLWIAMTDGETAVRVAAIGAAGTGILVLGAPEIIKQLRKK